MKQNWNLALKNKKSDGLYNVAVRYYENGVEKYLDTEHRISKEDWEAKVGKRFRAAEDIREIVRTKIHAIHQVISDANQDLTFDLFKAVWKGKQLRDERSWVALLDKHLELKRYKLGTMRVYLTTRDILKKIPHDLSLGSFTTVEDYKRLEGWMKKYTNIGKTALAINMQNIKAIAATGYDPRIGLKWIKTDAFKYYKKPLRKPGMAPNTAEDYRMIRDFDVSTIGNDARQRASYAFGRDFWCWMVLSGGMEARSIALLEWKNVYKDYFEFSRAKVEDHNVIVRLAVTERTQYMFDRYGVKGGKYVFPFVTEDMTPVQIENAITNLSNKITRRVQVVARELGIKPLPSCKRARPTFAVLSDKVLTLEEQQQQMGHKDIRTTKIYKTHLPLEDRIAASKKFHDSLDK